jgi:hypothetical protein
MVGRNFSIYQWAGRNGHQVLEVFKDVGVAVLLHLMLGLGE